jgi:DNA-directed RNA polymerase specialized sigma24 family protein
LRGLARRTLAGHPQRVADADDAAQSAFLCFWRQAEQGQLAPEMHRDNLWSLLATITVRKALKQIKRERALKRGAGRVLGESALAEPEKTGTRPLETIVGELPASDFDIHCEELLEMLDDELRVFAVFRLMGQSNREIANRLGCTERKVERKLNLIRLRWEHEVAE